MTACSSESKAENVSLSDQNGTPCSGLFQLHAKGSKTGTGWLLPEKAVRPASREYFTRALLLG
eukprot:766865-Amphidinium_carterae.3